MRNKLKNKKIWRGVMVLSSFCLLFFLIQNKNVFAAPPTVAATTPPSPSDSVRIDPGFWFSYNDPDSDQMVDYWVRIGTDPANLQLAASDDIYFYPSPSLPLVSGGGFMIQFLNLNYGTTYYFYVGVTDSTGASATTPQVPAVGLYGFTTPSIQMPLKSEPPFDETMLPFPNQQLSFQDTNCQPVCWCPGLGIVEYKVYVGPEHGSLAPVVCELPMPACSGMLTCYLPDTSPLLNGVYWWDIVAEARNGESFGVSHTPSIATAWRVWVQENTPPSCPITYTPPNDSTDRSIDQDISWSEASDAERDPLSYDVYFGTVNPPPFKVNTSAAIYETGTLNNNATYYWKVKVKDGTSTTDCAVQSFTTEQTLAVGNTSGYAWGENIGWLSLNCDHSILAHLGLPLGPANCAAQGGTDYGVLVGNGEEDDNLYGYAWSENIGWISLNCNEEPIGGTNHCLTGGDGQVDYGVSNDGTGALSDYAWSETAGWIDFNPAGDERVMIDADTGIFSGFAWGENIGWISFGDGASYQGETTWRGIPNKLSTPTGLKHTDNPEGPPVSITWEWEVVHIPGEPGKQVSYVIYMKEINPGECTGGFCTSVDLTSSAPSLTVSADYLGGPLSFNTPYTIKVMAIYSGYENSDFSDLSSAYTSAGTPANLSGTVASETQINWTWQSGCAPANCESGFYGELYQTDDPLSIPSLTPLQILPWPVPISQSWPTGGLNRDQKYILRVKAKNADFDALAGTGDETGWAESAPTATLKGPQIAINPTAYPIGYLVDHYNFGVLAPGESKSVTMLICNLGDADLTVSSASIIGSESANFNFTPSDASFTLGVDHDYHKCDDNLEGPIEKPAKHKVVIKFTSQSSCDPGPVTSQADFVLLNNDANDADKTVELKGVCQEESPVGEGEASENVIYDGRIMANPPPAFVEFLEKLQFSEKIKPR